jgi:hypothetical protein
MKSPSLFLTAALLVFCAPGSLRAQVPNEGLANRIFAAQKANATLLKQYSWNSRTEVMDGIKVEDIRIESVSCGPDGHLQRTMINDQSSPLPRGFLRKRIAEDERKKVEKYFKALTSLLDQYTLPSAGKVLDFVSQAQIQAPDSNGLLQLTGSSVVTPGDSLILSVDAVTRQNRKMQITTIFEQDMVQVTVTFKTLSSGLTHVQFAQLDVAAKGLSVQVHNYDYNQNN